MVKLITRIEGLYIEGFAFLGDAFPDDLLEEARGVSKNFSALVADALAKRLAQLDPASASHYQARHRAFADKWQAAIQRWEKQATPLKGMPVVVQHHGPRVDVGLERRIVIRQRG